LLVGTVEWNKKRNDWKVILVPTRGASADRLSKLSVTEETLSGENQSISAI
jgi:hypothetical protein